MLRLLLGELRVEEPLLRKAFRSASSRNAHATCPSSPSRKAVFSGERERERPGLLVWWSEAVERAGGCRPLAPADSRGRAASAARPAEDEPLREDGLV